MHRPGCLRIATDYAEFLAVAVRIGGVTISQQVPPWQLPTEEQLAWCRTRFGFDPMGIIPFDALMSNVVGLAFVLPYTARPGYRTGDRIYARGMLVADTDDLVVPQWAFFCRAVVDAGDLPLTASREALQETAALQFVRTRIGFRLLTELIIVEGRTRTSTETSFACTPTASKRSPSRSPKSATCSRSNLPYQTSLGERTVRTWSVPRAVPYVRDADAYHAVRRRAHAGVFSSTRVGRTRPTSCRSSTRRKEGVSERWAPRRSSNSPDRSHIRTSTPPTCS